MPETYKPGRRTYGQNYKMSENRYAWVDSAAGSYIILVGKDEGSGSDVVLFHPRPGKVPDFQLNFSNLTLEELTAIKELIATAIEWAEPVVMRRDKEAKDAWDQGDDSHTRNYRPLPTVVYRKRPQPEHYESVSERPEGVSEGSGGSGGSDSGGIRGAGDELAEPQSDDDQSEDDSTQAD